MTSVATLWTDDPYVGSPCDHILVTAVLQKIIGKRNGHEVLFSLSLGCHSKQAGDERYLTHDVPLFDAAHLPFSHHVHHLLSLQGSPRALE